MIYWGSTILLCLVLALSSASYVFHMPTIIGIRELGFPDFFRVQLAILKLLAVVALIIPIVPSQFKEWAYAGAALFFLTAIVAHMANKDSWFIIVINIVFILVLLVSNISYKQYHGL